MTKTIRTISPLIMLAMASSGAHSQIRPPAVPLIAHDTYFSIWSTTNNLTDGPTRHWTGTEHPLTSLIQIDGKTFRLMGNSPEVPSALPQAHLKVTPTQTIYRFAGQGVTVDLTFTTPSLPEDIEVLSRPATYITWKAKSVDGQPHDVSVYFSADARTTVHEAQQTVRWSRAKAGSLSVLRIGSEEQPVLVRKGDNVRIDWGHLLVAGAGRGYLGSGTKSLDSYLKKGSLPSDERATSRRADEDVVAAFTLPFGKVGANPISKHLVVAYDDQYSVQFMGHNLRPYWRRGGMDDLGLIRVAERDYSQLVRRCDAFDRELSFDLVRLGGKPYADIATLAYRQSLAAQKVVADAKGQPLMFSKENFSGGFIGTVDVLYPASPLLLAFSPSLTKASLIPILEYAASSRWPWPYAPHDLGTYPKANGQTYGDGEHGENGQMPVEETGNVILMLGALAKVEDNAQFSAKYWPILSRWAAYLADKGFDPERQLTTDDFAGHIAHNVNLSAKAIEALGAYALLAEKLGKTDEATKYRGIAKSFAERWMVEALEGDHYKLVFDRPGTWSQKYNLVWDRLLGLNLFPRSVADRETAYYKTKLNAYGLPLDSREDYTKLDWIVWTATLTPDIANFRALVDPIARFLNDTPDRVPMTDWYFTSQPRHRGFQARSVVGGVFIKMLDDPSVWKKYALRDQTKFGPWASMPTPPVVTEVVSTARKGGGEWAYRFTAPAEGWNQPNFDASTWTKGQSGFGIGEDRGGVIRTEWNTDDIWMRREFTLPKGNAQDLRLEIAHDDDAEVYINGVLAIRLPGAAGYETYDLPKAIQALLKPGKNLIAIHCRDTGGDNYVDAGFVTVRLKP